MMSMASSLNKLLMTPLLMQYVIYKHLALGPTALGLGAYKSHIALAKGVITITYILHT